MADKNKRITEITQARLEAIEVIRVSELALKKHIRLIKKREHISSIVALIERLRGDIKQGDPKVIYGHIEELNNLTGGFAAHAIKHSAIKFNKRKKAKE